MNAVWTVFALWVVFAASHMALSSQRWRPRLVKVLGRLGFQGVYSLVALAVFVPLVTIYLGSRHTGPYLGTLAGVPGIGWFVYLGMGVAFCLLVGGLLRPSPASVVPGAARVGGVFHVTRHPMLMSFGLFGTLHLLVVAVHASELAFFAGFPLFVIAGCRHQDQRKLAEGDEAFRSFHDATPFLPLSRPAGVVLAIREQPVAVVIGIALTVGVRLLHPTMFGG